MNLKFLASFIKVSSENSFSEAAESLHLTQPAVSRQIAALEEELNARLFDRIGRNVHLTEAGRLLLPRAAQLLDLAADMRRSVASLGTEVAGQLSMGTSHHIGLHRLPPVLNAYTRRHPEVTLDIRFLGSEAVCSAVERGALELGIVTLPTRGRDSLQKIRLWVDPLHFVVAPTHPLAATRVPVDLPDLLQHPAILPSPGTFTRDILEQMIAPSELPIRTGLSTDYLETLKMLVSVGLGWSLLPETLLGPELKVIRVKRLKLSRTLGAVYHRERTLSNAARAMLRACQSDTGTALPGP